MKNLFPIVVLAGGRGIRLGAISDMYPKSLIPIDKKPFLSYQLKLLYKSGFNDIIMALGHKQNDIVEYLKKNYPKVKYVLDTGDLGTGGSIKAALSFINSENFFVTYSDGYLQSNYKEIQSKFEQFDKKSLMVIYKNQNKGDKSNVLFDGNKIVEYDKNSNNKNMEYIDYGISIFNKECFDIINNKFDLSEIHKKLVKNNDLDYYIETNRFYEIGSLSGINEFSEYISTKGDTMSFSKTYLGEVQLIAKQLDDKKIEDMVGILRLVKDRMGRIFFIGSGGSAANASHAVNDFRKIAGIECYSPSENVSELTARINDDGWETAYSKWLEGSKLNKNDCIVSLSVGGGNEDKNISINIVNALKYAHEIGADILGIVGRDGGFTAKIADEYIIIPTIDDNRVTPHQEEFQSVVLHLLVSHPLLHGFKAKWESMNV